DNPVDVRAGYTRFLPRRRDPLKCPDVLDTRGLAVHHPVALRDEEIRLGRRVDIEGRPIAGKQVFERLAAANRSRDSGDMADVIGGMQFIDDVPVAVVALLTPAQDDLFVVFGGHGFSPLEVYGLESGHKLALEQARSPAATHHWAPPFARQTAPPAYASSRTS